jgi:hypothetical protein
MQSWVSCKSFHPLWCWVWLASLWEMVYHPSRCGLTVVRIDATVGVRLEWWRWLECIRSKVGVVEMVGMHQVKWFVMLESDMDQILGVDTPGQHVQPCLRYGTACLLIRYAIGCVSCSIEWGQHQTLWSYFVTYFVIFLNHMVQEGTFVRETLALQAGTACSGNHSKAWHTPV